MFSAWALSMVQVTDVTCAFGVTPRPHCAQHPHSRLLLIRLAGFLRQAEDSLQTAIHADYDPTLDRPMVTPQPNSPPPDHTQISVGQITERLFGYRNAINDPENSYTTYGRVLPEIGLSTLSSNVLEIVKITENRA